MLHLHRRGVGFLEYLPRPDIERVSTSRQQLKWQTLSLSFAPLISPAFTRSRTGSPPCVRHAAWSTVSKRHGIPASATPGFTPPAWPVCALAYSSTCGRNGTLMAASQRRKSSSNSSSLVIPHCWASVSDISPPRRQGRRADAASKCAF